jgi:hypothetical protein
VPTSVGSQQRDGRGARQILVGLIAAHVGYVSVQGSLYVLLVGGDVSDYPTDFKKLRITDSETGERALLAGSHPVCLGEALHGGCNVMVVA